MRLSTSVRGASNAVAGSFESRPIVWALGRAENTGDQHRQDAGQKDSVEGSAPPIDATGAPSPSTLSRLRRSAPIKVPSEPLRLSYHVAASLHVHPRERQVLLELDDVASRLREELKLLQRENRPAPKNIGPFSPN